MDPTQINVLVIHFLVSGAVYQEETCTLENFNPQCPRGSIVVIQEAILGRLRLGACMTEKWQLGCGEFVTKQVYIYTSLWHYQGSHVLCHSIFSDNNFILFGIFRCPKSVQITGTVLFKSSQISSHLAHQGASNRVDQTPDWPAS